MADEKQTIKIHKLIGGTLYPLELKRQRFEQVMDRIDRAVELGASFTQIKRQFADHLVSTGKAVDPDQKPDSVQPKESKSDICKKGMDENPGKSVGDWCKIVSANNPHISNANARYLLTKLMAK